MKKRMDPKAKKPKVIGIRYVPTPDVDARVVRVIDILLRAARHSTPSEEGTHAEEQEPHSQTPAEDALGGGSGGNDSHGEG